MTNRDGFTKILVSALLIFGAALWAYPRMSEGACGAAASSCKNCHEIKGEKKVNSTGAYHTQHAFGDFCAFCHSGNTAAAVKEEAHQGMVKPLADLKKSCASCHPDDYEKRAQGYGAGTPAAGAAGPEASASPGEVSEIPPPTPDPSAVRPEDLVDYNLSVGSREKGAGTEVKEVVEETSGQEGKAAGQAPPVPGKEKAQASKSGGSRTPVAVGILVIIGVVAYLLFRKK